MRVRDAGPEDAAYLAEACVGVVRFMQHETTDGSIDASIASLPDQVNEDVAAWSRSFVTAADRAAFVAETVGGEPIGCILGRMGESAMPVKPPGEVGEVSVCWVEPDHREAGVGRALLAELEGWFLARGVRRLEVAFMAKNETAGAVWARLGFSPFRVFASKEIGGRPGGGRA